VKVRRKKDGKGNLAPFIRTFPQSVTGSFPAYPEILGASRTCSRTCPGRRSDWTRRRCPLCIWDVFVALNQAFSLDTLDASAFLLHVPGDSAPLSRSFRSDLPFGARSGGSRACRGGRSCACPFAPRRATWLAQVRRHRSAKAEEAYRPLAHRRTSADDVRWSTVHSENSKSPWTDFPPPYSETCESV